MDIILILTPCWGLSAPPLSLASLSSFLREKGFHVLALDLNIDMFQKCKDEYKKFWGESEYNFWKNKSLVERFLSDNCEIIHGYLNRICDSNAKVVGFSVYESSMFFSLALARMIKEKCPDKIIIFGGPHCSQYFAGNFIISQDYIDIVVKGEGEETLFDILQLNKKENKMGFCPGTMIKKERSVIDYGDRPLINNLDSLPFPDFSDFPVENYIRKDAISVSTSRGCINRCIFCNEWTYWKKYRYKTGDYIFREIKHQLSIYPRVINIEFCDSLLNGNLKELSHLCDLIIKERINIHWSGQAIIHPGLNSGLLSKFKKAGCGCLDYGIESGSQKVVDKMRKGFRILEAERIIKQTHEAGIDVVLNFMFGHPGETEDEFKETLGFISRNKNYITAVNPSPSFCGIAPGTYLYNHPEEFNISTPIGNGMYWEANDNKNDYLIRMRRFEEFCNLTQSLGIKSNYSQVTLVNRYMLIGDYYFYKRNYSEALKYYDISVEREGENNKILEIISSCHRYLEQNP